MLYCSRIILHMLTKASGETRWQRLSTGNVIAHGEHTGLLYEGPVVEPRYITAALSL
jgi:hypothetical protein